MGYFRFQERIRILSGVHVNLSKRGASASPWAVPARQSTFSRRGTRTTVGLPGVNRRRTLTTNRRPRLTPIFGTDAAGSARPGGASPGCAAGAGADGLKIRRGF